MTEAIITMSIGRSVRGFRRREAAKRRLSLAEVRGRSVRGFRRREADLHAQQKPRSPHRRSVRGFRRREADQVEPRVPRETGRSVRGFRRREAEINPNLPAEVFPRSLSPRLQAT